MFAEDFSFFSAERNYVLLVSKGPKTRGLRSPRTLPPSQGRKKKSVFFFSVLVSFFQFPRLCATETQSKNLLSCISKSHPPAKESVVGTILSVGFVTSKTEVCCAQLVWYKNKKSTKVAFSTIFYWLPRNREHRFPLQACDFRRQEDKFFHWSRRYKSEKSEKTKQVL